MTPRFDEHSSLEEIQEFFSHDRFATERAGCRIMEAGVGYALCSMEITPDHRNAQGSVMGGAIFTLADFALGVGANIGQAPSVSVENSFKVFSSSKGTKLIARCTADKMGRTLGFFTIDVTDDLDVLIARMSATVCRLKS